MQIKNGTFIVTGGGSGLGAAVAQRLVDEGGNALIADIADTGQSTADSLGEQARFVRTDVTDPQNVDAAIDVAQQTFGNLAGVVNCAGIALAEKTLGKQGPHDLDRLVDGGRDPPHAGRRPAHLQR